MRAAGACPQLPITLIKKHCRQQQIKPSKIWKTPVKPVENPRRQMPISPVCTICVSLFWIIFFFIPAGLDPPVLSSLQEVIYNLCADERGSYLKEKKKDNLVIDFGLSFIYPISQKVFL